MVAKNTKKSWVPLQGWCSARAVPLLNHCMAAQQIINYSCKPAWVQTAEAASGVRLHEEVDVCCGSWWLGAPRGFLRAALSFSISHLASPEPSMASHMLSLIRSSMTPKVKSVEGCSSVMFWSTQHQWPAVHWPLVDKQYFGPFGPFFR